MLSVIVKCLFVQKKFIVKLIPCYRLNSEFMHYCVVDIMSLLESCGARILAVIDDNNRVNQTFFSKFTPFTNAMDCQGHYRSEEAGICYIMILFIFIVKNIRNNSITEKSKTIQLTHPDTNELMTTKWSDLVELYNHEQTQ